MTTPLESIGDQIRQFRLAAGLTQTALARAAGIAQPSLSEIEAGVSIPTPETIESLSTALGRDAEIRVHFSRKK